MNRKAIKLIIVVLSLFFSTTSLYSQTVADNLCKGSIYVKTNDYEGVIFCAECPENRKDDKSYRWSPTEKDIALAEKLIKKYILKRVKRLERVYGVDTISPSITPVVHLNLDKYYRQYMGLKDERGREILFVMCFWKEKECEFPYWKRGSIAICDGGSYYWNITVDLKRKKCFSYSVHQ